MCRSILTLVLGLMISGVALSQDLSGFNKRFELIRNENGGVTTIKLKNVIPTFTIKPFLEQLKSELKREQASGFVGNEAEIDEMLIELGLNPYALAGEEGSEEAQKLKESLLNIGNIDVDQEFSKADNKKFWKEFEDRMKEALTFIDPTVLANLDDARFFYKRQVTHKVIVWALKEAQKRFSEVPVLNIVTFIIVRVHDMMLEQVHFHHNMLLHYFETMDEAKLGMTKDEVDRAVSSIYEYRIELAALNESNKAAKNWNSYGMNKFYMEVRAGNTKVRGWTTGAGSRNYTDVKKINYAFASVTEENARKIYHLHCSGHMFTQKPALAYDYSRPTHVKRIRSLLTLGGVALGFINIPDWIKSNVQNFISSMYVQQVRLEGGLVGYFESTGDTSMMKKIYAQRANFYIVE